MTAVALLGTGHMGSAMARALADDGHSLVLWNRSPDRAAALAADLGASLAGTPAEAAGQVDVVVSMLADDDAVRDVHLGPDGSLSGVRSSGVVVDMSTVRPTVIRELEAPARARGAGILDAPVSGSVSLAEKGELTVMVGGTADDLERARPVLESIGSRVLHIGGLGAGATIKLAVNALVYSINQGVAEALVLAERAGLERSAAYEVFATSAVAAPFVIYKRAAFEQPDEAPTAFSIELAAKDLRLILDLADETGTPMPQARTNLAAVEATITEAGSEQDLSAVAGHLRRSAHDMREGR
ncbi:MAG: NAD(P)-dependent oxidoreductase [Candidatus Limnocylindrales bacterium]|jgi:3-hydroxyisobutyrate dehydrogenase-like beta-hydroxyacid dehydrogenase